MDRSGICPVCGLFHTRQRVIHHIEHSCESCKAAVQVGLVQTLPEAQMKELDAAKERREARKQLVSYLALRGEDEVVAASYRCLSVHAVRCGGAPFSSDAPLCAFLGIAFLSIPCWIKRFCLLLCRPCLCAGTVTVSQLSKCLFGASSAFGSSPLFERTLRLVLVTTHPRSSAWHWRCWQSDRRQGCVYVRTVRHLWVASEGCKFEFARSLLVVCPLQRSLVFFLFRRRSGFVARCCLWLLLHRCFPGTLGCPWVA